MVAMRWIGTRRVCCWDEEWSKWLKLVAGPFRLIARHMQLIRDDFISGCLTR